MTTALTLQTLLDACAPGGASVLTVVTELAPAAGLHAGVAPARYVSGTQSTYAFETRFLDGEPVSVTMLDGKSSALNRVEDAVVGAIRDGQTPLASTPRFVINYEAFSAMDLELPHRAFDGHLRAGTVDGKPLTQDARYRAVRDATPADVRPVLTTSPASCVLGSWDSSRASHQARYRSALVGEVIGVLADQGPEGHIIAKRGGARKDDLAPSVRLSGKDMEALLSAQESELSSANVDRIRKAIAKAGKGTTSASPLGLGSIPPSLDTPGLVSCRRIIRSHVLSFATLRQLRVGGPLASDVAARALMAAWALCALAHANDELVLRANCDLVELEAPRVTLDLRQGRTEEITDFTSEHMDAVLSEAIEYANTVAGISWAGQEFHVTGNPIIMQGADADADGE